MKDIFKKSSPLLTAIIILIIILLITLLFRNQERFFSSDSKYALTNIGQNPAGTTFFNTAAGTQWNNLLISKELFNSITVSFNLGTRLMGTVVGISNNKNIGRVDGNAGIFDRTTAFFYMGYGGPDGTLYRTIVKNNTPSTPTKCDTTTKFKIVYDGTSVKFYANDNLISSGAYNGPVYVYAKFQFPGFSLVNFSTVQENKCTTCVDSITTYRILFKNPAFRIFF
jgi:hypothetical protein